MDVVGDKPMDVHAHKSTLTILFILMIGVGGIAIYQITYPPTEPNLALEALRLKYTAEHEPVVDHTQFEILNRDFTSPVEVTLACISCHNTRHLEVLDSPHWNWDRIGFTEERGITAIGKKNVMNNYCIGVATNEMTCAGCHVGFGMPNFLEFDFTNPENVDCLSCHASSDYYQKGRGLGGAPATTVDLREAAITVGRPTIQNCGNCHFLSGGGNNVKHGDLEVALYNADRMMDVHMARDGIHMTCVDCHTADNHEIKGKLYSVSANNVNRLHCEDCHGGTPHLTDMLNLHTAKIACQTCHIPTYAKENPTKLSWTWSDAGLMDESGRPMTVEDSLGTIWYMSTKGSFTWGTNLKPDYVWFNGTADHYYLGEPIDTTRLPIRINTLHGSYHDPGSKIIPVKIHRGDQIFDTEYLTIIQPHLSPAGDPDSAYWREFDWDRAAASGMRRIGLPYSGRYGFIETEMYWPVNHMVSPAAQALQCVDCHTPNNGRLAGLDTFYLPGRDRNKTLDTIGWGLILISLFGVVLHASMRTVTYFRKPRDLDMTPYEEFDHDKADPL
jgi:octaheme c-type cytochrome (tetrathionate reductase family)